MRVFLHRGRGERKVSMACQDLASGDWDVLVTHSDDDGATPSTDVRVTTAETPIWRRRPGDCPGLVVDPEGEGQHGVGQPELRVRARCPRSKRIARCPSSPGVA